MADIVSALRNRSLVEYIPELVLHSDGTYRCACRLHNGTNPDSFTVFPSSNRYFCFSCLRSGDIIQYVMDRDECNFDTAIATLADDFGLTISDDDNYREVKSLADRNASWAKLMENDLDSIVEYLHKRGLTDETIAAYHLGYSKKLSALSIPMFDGYKRVAGFLYRFFEGKSKYKNGKNVDGLYVKGEFVFGVPQAYRYLKETRNFFLAEGAFDCMSMVQQHQCCAAYCGISVTARHVALIKNLVEPVKNAKIIICPDNDNRANKLVGRARELFRKHAPKLVVKVCVIPPDCGCKDFNDMLVAGMDIASSCTYESIDLYCAKQVLAEDDDRDVQERNLVAYVKTVSNPLVKQDICEYTAKLWGKSIEAVRELLSIKGDTVDEKLSKISSVESAYTALENLKEEEAILTGFPNIDDAVHMHRKEVTMIAAYSFQGKSTFLCELILNWCIAQRRRVLFFSLEMSKEQVMKVIISKIVQIPQYKVVDYIHEHKEVYQLICDKLSNLLYIVDENNLSMDDIEEYTKLVKSKLGDLDIIAVDYFGYMQNVETVEAQESTAKRMKAIAKSLNLMFVMLAQLNKASQSKDKEGKFRQPTMNDIKGAGGQGASADTLFLIYRQVLQDPSLSPIDRERLKNITTLIIAKCREFRNENSMFELEYNPATSRLTEKVNDN